MDEKASGMLEICVQAKENCKEWEYGIGCEEKYVKEVPKGFDISNGKIYRAEGNPKRNIIIFYINK